MVLCCVVVLAVFSVPFLCLRIPRDSGHVILIVACFNYTILPFCCVFLNNFINVFFGVAGHTFSRATDHNKNYRRPREGVSRVVVFMTEIYHAWVLRFLVHSFPFVIVFFWTIS